MRRLCAQAARDLERRLRQEPYDLELAQFWMEACDAAGQLPETVGGLCLPVPGEPWPDPSMVGRFLEPHVRRRDWHGALKLLSDLSPQGPPNPVTPQGWDSHCRLLGAVHAQRALALAGLGTWDQAGTALSESRHWGGSQGVREALVTRGSLFSGPGGDPSAWRNLLAQALGRHEAEPPPMPAAEPPLRLVVLGMPRWILQWAGLRQAPELALWSPSELHWEVADRRQEEAHRTRYGWGPGPRWALFRGEELRTSGPDCPTPKALAALLEGQGTPQLQRLQRVLEAQPDHHAAHRERFDLLLKRMPDRRLEPLLAQDAAQALVTLEFDPQAPWKPDPEVWGQAAQQALPQLEQALRAWPNRIHLWQAWISWAPVPPVPPVGAAPAPGGGLLEPQGRLASLAAVRSPAGGGRRTARPGQLPGHAGLVPERVGEPGPPSPEPALPGRADLGAGAAAGGGDRGVPAPAGRPGGPGVHRGSGRAGTRLWRDDGEGTSAAEEVNVVGR